MHGPTGMTPRNGEPRRSPGGGRRGTGDRRFAPPPHRARHVRPLIATRQTSDLIFFSLRSVSPSQQARFLFLLLLLPILGEKGACSRSHRGATSPAPPLAWPSTGIKPGVVFLEVFSALPAPVLVRAELRQRLCFPPTCPGTWEGAPEPPWAELSQERGASPAPCPAPACWAKVCSATDQRW